MKTRKPVCSVFAGLLLLSLVLSLASLSQAQTPPSMEEIEGYTGLHQAAHSGDISALQSLISQGASLEARDALGRTAVHIAAHASHDQVIELLANASADLNALDDQYYDVVTIAAVADDYPLLDLALNNGAKADNITSPYEGTALIAAAHLGHHQVVARLIDGGAPLDHINNLGWTALIEAVILGDGGPDHVATVEHLLKAGASTEITNRQGETPLQLATQLQYQQIIALLQ